MLALIVENVLILIPSHNQIHIINKWAIYHKHLFMSNFDKFEYYLEH